MHARAHAVHLVAPVALLPPLFCALKLVVSGNLLLSALLFFKDVLVGCRGHILCSAAVVSQKLWPRALSVWPLLWASACASHVYPGLPLCLGG